MHNSHSLVSIPVVSTYSNSFLYEQHKMNFQTVPAGNDNNFNKCMVSIIIALYCYDVYIVTVQTRK